MRKIELVTNGDRSETSLGSIPCNIEVVIPYDSGTGHVYLNATGGDEADAFEALRAIEIDDEAQDRIRTTLATVDFSVSAQAREDLFPVYVPFERNTHHCVVSAIGSSVTEVEVNLDFWGKDHTQYDIINAALIMPQLIAEPSPPGGLPSP